MSRIAIDTRSQNAWKELIHKEAATRISSHQNFKSNPTGDEWFKRAFYTQTISKPIGRSLPIIVSPSRSKSHYIPNNSFDILGKTLHTENDSNILKDMYPIKKEHEEILFDGYSQEEKGRYKYLNLRKEIPLEERYQYPVSNSMIYGWKLGKTGQQFKTPTYARGKIIEESFYRRNGVF
jgi:hypothetical protein